MRKQLEILEDHAGLAADLLDLGEGNLATGRELHPVVADLHGARTASGKGDQGEGRADQNIAAFTSGKLVKLA